MVGRAVPVEHVEAEVGAGFALHRVRVVGAALRVVPLDRQVGSLQAVVVRFPGGRRACAGDVDGVERGIVVVATHLGHQSMHTGMTAPSLVDLQADHTSAVASTAS